MKVTMNKHIDSRVRVYKLRTKPQKPTAGRVKELATYERELIRWQTQQDDALRLLTYFNKVWQRSKNKQVVNHPLTRIALTVKPCNKFLVRFIANIWFEHMFRGNNLTGKCSGWAVRKSPKLNKQMAKLVKTLTELNTGAVEEMWTVAAQKNTVEVVISTKVTFENEEQAALFCELLSTMESMNDTEDYGTDGCGELQQTSQAENTSSGKFTTENTAWRSEQSELRDSLLARYRRSLLVHGEE